MSTNRIFCKFGLIGENLDLKKNISLKIHEDGVISELSYEDLENNKNFQGNGDNHLLIPGLINSHIHIGDSFAKERGFNKNLIDVVAPPNGLKHQLLKKTEKEIIFKGIINSAREMISNGITCFVDFREGGLEGVQIINEAMEGEPIRSVKMGRFREEGEIKSIFKNADGLGLSSYRNLSPDEKECIRTLKSSKNKLVACHDAEVKKDINLFKEIISDNLVDIIVHGTQYTKKELNLLKENNISLVLCPRSNGYFGVGFPPILDVVEFDILTALGTDNIMSINPDLFEEMRYLYLIARVLSKKSNKSPISAKDLLKMTTINAAKILKLQSSIGSISLNKYADFFIINLDDLNYYNNQITTDIIFPLIVQRTKPENIKKVFIGGKNVFERKK
ncbi:MAG: amidohydrolase family protein [Candidatus Lokiarchaeota archaeon]|nr:amidohydrolase family protein [Candidatus Lokiarchaeota archaeon]MBD3342981.1 amidohydrolase family protein [Candidatus Lokiarchaeota archaeon]